jgi:hypothetical protein
MYTNETILCERFLPFMASVEPRLAQLERLPLEVGPLSANPFPVPSAESWMTRTQTRLTLINNDRPPPLFRASLYLSFMMNARTTQTMESTINEFCGITIRFAKNPEVQL